MTGSHDITAEIHSIVDGRLAAGLPVNVLLVTIEILSKRPLEEGENADFYLINAVKSIKRQVAQVLRRYTYPVYKRGDRLRSPIESCSDDELITEVELLNKMAKGSIDHAEELEAFVKRRQARAVTA